MPSAPARKSISSGSPRDCAGISPIALPDVVVTLMHAPCLVQIIRFACADWFTGDKPAEGERGHAWGCEGPDVS